MPRTQSEVQRPTVRGARRARVAALLAAAMLAAGCIAQATPAPSPSASTSPAPVRAGSSSPGTAASPTTVPTPRPVVPADVGCAALLAKRPGPRPEPTIPPGPIPTISHPDAASVDAIGAAEGALRALDSYRGTTDVIGRTVADLQPSTIDLGFEGTISHANGLAVDALLGTRMREPDGSAAISGGTRFVLGDGMAWAVDNISGVLEPMRGALAVEAASILTPEGLAARVVVPFAGGYRRVGAERHAGIAAEHYRASDAGRAAYRSTLGFGSDIAADLWIATDGGYLAAARVTGTGSHREPATGTTIDDGFQLGFEVTHPNAAGNIVRLPVAPVPDPIRPSGPPVDLRLDYRVEPSDGTRPTAADLDAIGVALRTRLDIAARPVRVEVVGSDRLTVTICGTTRPDVDRQLITSPGALTIVPLPSDRYGSTSSPGGTPLPTVGGRIDPDLEPVAPAAGLGLTSAHVDPTTGRRGLALRLGNKQGEAFLAYAAAHPGEYVAVVLDGIVLAILPIEGATARGSFVFTGDYTEAETHLLASWLYRDPIRFTLRPTGDVEIPAR